MTLLENMTLLDMIDLIDNIHFQHAWEDGWHVYNYCQKTGNTWLSDKPESNYSAERTTKMTIEDVARQMMISGGADPTYLGVTVFYPE